MKKELQWNVTVDGEVYRVHCETFKSVFDVYVDDELTARVPRHSEDGADMEENITVGGKVCQFVVYDGQPDLSVDGILQGVEAAMRRAELRNRLLKIVGGLFLIAVGIYAISWWFFFRSIGQPLAGGDFLLGCMIIFVLVGLWLIVSALRRRKKF